VGVFALPDLCSVIKKQDMKKLISAAVLILVLISCNQIESKKTKKNKIKSTEIMDKQSKEQIEALLEVYKKSLNTSDVALAVSLYTKEGVFMPTQAPSAIGSDQIKASYEFIFSQIQLSVEFYLDEIIIDNNMAFATTSSKGTTLIHANGQTVPEENRELFVFEKINGDWKIARYMFNKTK